MTLSDQFTNINDKKIIEEMAFNNRQPEYFYFFNPARGSFSPSGLILRLNQFF